jgi:hypothetical protein
MDPIATEDHNALFNFSEFLQNRARYSNLVNPAAFPLNDQHRQGIAKVIEGIDRVSVQGVLVRAVASHLQDGFSKHAAALCDTFRDQSQGRSSHAVWVEAAAGGQRDRMLDGIRSSLELATSTASRDLLLDCVLAYSDIGEACLAAANPMSIELTAALGEIEAAYQTCFKILRGLRYDEKCKCSSEASSNNLGNEEFLEFCCDISRELSNGKADLHLTFRTISKVVEQTPGWRTRRDALRVLDKLYRECNTKNMFPPDGTDDVKEHLVDVMGGITEGMSPSERERFCEEGFNFKVVNFFEAKLYEELKDCKRAMRGTKDSAATRDNRKPKPQAETIDAGKKHISEEARVQKAETKRLKKRRAKDRKALQKALAKLDLGDIT